MAPSAGCLVKVMNDFMWNAGDKTHAKTLSLYIIRSIVEKHGGTLTVDLETDTINIDVPADKEEIVAQEIEDAVGDMIY